MISPGIELNPFKCCPWCTSNVKITEIGGRDRVVCVTCDFVNWDNPKPVTATLVRKNGGLVLVQRKFEPFVGDWCLPGGFIEGCEDPTESAIREVFEETGLTINNPRLIEARAPGHGINVVILFYTAEDVEGEMVAGDDASDVGAFKKSELPKNIAFPHHRRLVDWWFNEYEP